jgi:N-terminal domain of reverse transcriptase
MTSSQDVGAPSHEEVQWHSIDWASCHRHVRRLQTRIVKATQEGRWNKVKALHHLLTHSFAGKRSSGQTGDRKPGQTNAGNGRANLVHPAGQISGRIVAQTPWLQAASAQEGVHPQEQWQDAPPGHAHDAR